MDDMDRMHAIFDSMRADRDAANLTFIDKLEGMGEDGVRHALLTNAFNPDNRTLAEKWLRHRAQALSETSQAEQIELARRAAAAAEEAADAAWEAAREAKTANTLATAALIMAIVAIAVSIIATFVRSG